MSFTQRHPVVDVQRSGFSELLTCVGIMPQPGKHAAVIRDGVGNILQDGDNVTVIKDLKVKGSSLVVKVGTRIKNIKLVDGDHDIDCKIDGIGAMKLKSEFVKKA